MSSLASLFYFPGLHERHLVLIGLSKSLLHCCFHEVANGGPKEGQFGPYMIADISFISGSKSQ